MDMTEFQITANFHFGVKIPNDARPGGLRYGSEDFGGSLTLTETVTAENEAIARQVGAQRLSLLAQQVKLFVANEAGIEVVTDENGVIQVRLPSGGEVTQNQGSVVPFTGTQQFDPTPSSMLGEDGSEVLGLDDPGQQANPAQAGGLPVKWDGRPVRIYDNRGQKQNGQIPATRPDLNAMFLDVDASAPPSVKYEGAWSHNKDGSPSKKFQRMLELYDQQQSLWQAQQGGNDEAPF